MSKNDVLLKALKSVYAVLDLNSYNLWREHLILKKCSSTIRLSAKTLAWDSTASTKDSIIMQFANGITNNIKKAGFYPNIMLYGDGLPPYQGGLRKVISF